MESIESKFSSDGSFTSDQARLRDQVDQRLSCPICLERFNDPRLLDCTHSYCKQCLINVLAKRPRDVDEEEEESSKDKLYCPKCRKVTHLGSAGIEGLPVNYALKDIVEVLPDDTFSPSTPVLPFRPFPVSVPICEEHRRHMEFYCETDSQLVCADCLVMPRHRGHDTVAARDIVERELDLLRQDSFENAERMLLKVREAVDSVSHMTDNVKDKGERTKSQIQKHFRDIREALEAREQALLDTTEDIIMKKVSKLERQQETLIKSKQDLEEKVVKLKHILANKSDYSFLKDKQRLVDGIAETIKVAKSKDRNPTESAQDGPDCFLPQDLLDGALTYGEVYCRPCPAQFTAHGEGLSKGFVEKVAQFKVVARDRYGQRSITSGATIKVVVQGPDHSSTPVSVAETSRGGEYLVKYTPTLIGYHLIRVTADGVKIQKSDSHAVVFNRRDYFSLGLPLKHISKTRLRCDPPVARIRSICCLPSGNVVFTDEFCLRIVDPSSSSVVRTIGSYGTGPGQFSSPQGLAVNKLSYIFVSDSRLNRIEKFSADGRHHLTLPKTPGTLSAPEGLAVLGEEKLFVADCGNDRIQVFLQKNGKHQGGFGRKGTGPGQFMSPKYLAMDTKYNRLLVSDTGNFRIQALTLDGKPLLEFGNQKLGSVYLSYPYFINVDEDGFILVTETRSHHITILTPRGAQVRRLGNQGDAPGQFRAPYGVCINSSKGQVIVTDSTSHCIQIF